MWSLGLSACWASGRGASGSLRIAPNHGSGLPVGSVASPWLRAKCLETDFSCFLWPAWHRDGPGSGELQALSCSWLCHFAQAFVWDLGKKKQVTAFVTCRASSQGVLIASHLTVFPRFKEYSSVAACSRVSVSVPYFPYAIG